MPHLRKVIDPYESDYCNIMAEELEDMDFMAFGSTYSKCEGSNTAWWILYSDSNEPVGFCGLALYEDDPFVFLCRSAIASSHRGMGLQRRMIYTRERYASKLGYDWACTYTSRDNIPSARNLCRCGYSLYTSSSVFGLSDGLYFCKRISK